LPVETESTTILPVDVAKGAMTMPIAATHEGKEGAAVHAGPHHPTGDRLRTGIGSNLEADHDTIDTNDIDDDDDSNPDDNSSAPSRTDADNDESELWRSAAIVTVVDACDVCLQAACPFATLGPALVACASCGIKVGVQRQQH
jgi:hypothetical protein